MKCTKEEIISDLEGFSPKVCSFNPPPTIKHKRVSVTIVCTPPPPTFFWGEGRGGGGRGVKSLPNFQIERGLYRISNFRGGLLVKRVVTFFKEGREGEREK